MLKIQDIRELIKAIDQSSIEEFKYEQEGTKITMKKERTVVEGAIQPIIQQTQPVVPQQQNSVEKINAESQVKEEVKQNSSAVKIDVHKITSPMVGTFYSSPSPEAPPYVKIGDQLNKDSVVCIIEAMKLMNEIEAEIKGEVVEILVENGQLVEYGQELFLVKPE